MRFSYNNIKFKRHPYENWLVISGEVTNESGKNFHAVVFRILVFIKTTPIGNIIVPIKGFQVGQTRTFEAPVGEVDYKMLEQISRYEIYPESAY